LLDLGAMILLSQILVACLGATQEAYALNVIGYINYAIQPGDNLIAPEQLLLENLNTGQWASPASLDDFAPGVGNYPYGSVPTGVFPDGTTVEMWDSDTGQFSAPSTYYAASGWTINYEISIGDGVKLTSQSAFNFTEVGLIWQGPGFTVNSDDAIPGYVNTGTQFPPLPPTTPGTYLLSAMIPFDGTGWGGDDELFHDIVGRDPLVGESVTSLDPASQTYSTTTCTGFVLDGNGQPVLDSNGWETPTWSNGEPTLAYVGEAEFFTLVPEPGTLALLGAGAISLLPFAWRRKRNS
jgi:hypothetical protein